MHILILNWRDIKHPQAGGAERYLFEQAVHWVEEGHEVSWFCGRAAGLSRRDVQEGISIQRLGGTFGVYPAAWFQFLRMRSKPDVIIDGENGIPFFIPMITRIPVVLLIHHIHTDVWKREASAIVASVGSWLEKKLMPLVYRQKLVVTVSDSSAEMIKALFLNTEIEIVHNAVSDTYIPGEKSTEPEILYVGRLKRYKSIDILLRAIHELGGAAPFLHIVGQGDDEHRLRALTEELGIERVRFHGFISEDEKVRLMQRSWALVNPSRMEGWGITNIEANACGTPVIGSDVPGIRDSVSVGKSGVLVPYGDEQALSQEITALIAAKGGSMRESCVAWAAKFSWAASAEKFLNILISAKKVEGARDA